MNIREIIKQKVDLPEYIQNLSGVEVHKSGRDYRCKCPIHGSEESEPLIISDNGLYCCMACGSAGTAINFLADYKHIPYREALEELAKELNLDVERNQEYQDEVKVERQVISWTERTKRNVQNVLPYLKSKRGLTDETIEMFELGEDRGSITIPLLDHNGRYAGMAKRQFDQKPKYLNCPNNLLYDKSSYLYGFDKARKMRSDVMYVVEGYMDAMSGWQLGLPTVAYCNNGLTRDQIQFLDRHLRDDVIIILVPDNDEEGNKKIPRTREFFSKLAPRREVRVLLVPDSCKDMNDMLLAGIKPQELETEHLDKYALRILLDKCRTEEQEYKAAEEYLRDVRSLTKLDLMSYLSKRWELPEENIKNFFRVSGENSESILKEAANVRSCLTDLKNIYTAGGFKTHFDQIDNCIRRVERKQVVVIGASSGTGKSDWAIEYAIRAIKEDGLRVVFFSLEMPKGKVIERIIAKLVGCRISDVQLFLEKQGDRVNDLLAQLNEKLIIFDGNRYSMKDIEDRIKLINAKGMFDAPVDVVIVDYFGYMAGTSTFEDASISARRMKAIAKENDIILIMLSQLNRGALASEEPTMQNLKSTGDLEASGDIVILLWRPAKDPTLSLSERERLQYVTRVKVDKARDGMFGPNIMEFNYNPATSRLEEYY